MLITGAGPEYTSTPFAPGGAGAGTGAGAGAGLGAGAGDGTGALPQATILSRRITANNPIINLFIIILQLSSFSIL
jgi:hypothetical protein